MIDLNKSYWHCTNLYMLEFEIPGQCILDCSHSGPCDQDVEYWLPKLNLDLDPAKLALELSEYGAWDQDELQDHDENLARILWLACVDLQDQINAGGYIS